MQSIKYMTYILEDTWLEDFMDLLDLMRASWLAGGFDFKSVFVEGAMGV